MSRRSWLASSGAAVLGMACSRPPRSRSNGASSSSELTPILDRMAEGLLAEFPENATFRGVDRGSRAPLKHRLSARSNEARAGRTTAAQARLRSLQAIDRSKLDSASLFAYDSAVEAHRLAVIGAEFPYGDVNVLSAIASYVTTTYAVTQLSGNFVTVPDFLNSVHVTETAEDAEAYLDRVTAYAAGLDQETARLASDAAQHVVPPTFVLANIVGQLEGTLKQPVEQWSLVTALLTKVTAKSIAGDWRSLITRLGADLVAPALRRQLEGLKSLQPKATADAGVWKLPRGEEYYAWALEVGTTTTQTPDQVHAIGTEQVKAIESRLDGLLRAQGLTTGTPGERVAAMGKDPKFLFPNTERGRLDLLAFLNGRVAAVRARLPELFRVLPKADLVIKRVPPDIEAGAPSGYEVDGSLDGTRPASYYINLRDTANWPRFLLPTLTYHEGLPGHVWQGAFAGKLPLIRGLLQFNAYNEGWALYSEQLADEIGLYADDPFGRIGYLSDQMLRACRLVVDTGLHAKRWTREQSTAFLLRYTGQPADGLESETDRYCAMPGQACGYMIGRLEINRQRERAKAARGTAFDLASFDDAMLLCGSVPLTVLAEVTDRYGSSAANPPARPGGD